MAIALRLPPELDKRLTVLAKKTHHSKSYYAREAIARYIEDLEDYYLAMAVLENPGRIYTLEEVEKICGLDDKSE
ncbi:MAG TPA: ribbon-helix-helix protein, CopG family [Gammaproteobacteria bacterium]|nr:ribbon-helix-helix protein, CopG family [Gammaproteobacteria bacterium]